MTRKLCAVLTVLALAACFGRVSAWAAAPGDSHACCTGELSTPAGPVVAECCATPAAVQAVKPLSPQLSFVVVATPVLAPALAVESVEADASGPPGPRTFRSAAPARAPPLA